MMYFAVLIMAYVHMCNSVSPNIVFDSELQKNVEGNSLSSGIRQVTLKMDRSFTKMNPGENVIFSPLSVSSAMALLLLGAKGRTALQLADFLGLNTKKGTDLGYRIKLMHNQLGKLLTKLQYNTQDGYEIDTATGVFPNNQLSVKPNYINQVEKIYECNVWPLEYELRNVDAMTIINTWVANKTHGRITQLLAEPPVSETSLIVVSALYFSGNWKYPFIERLTKRVPFFVGKKPGSTKEETVNVDLMANTADIPYLDDEIRDCQMIGIPYRGDEVYMYVILPYGNLETFMQKFSESDLQSMIQSTQTATVTYALPKMKLDSNVDITNILRSIGLTVPFDPEQSAYSNIADAVKVDQVLHRVELEIDETGTKAAAATIVGTDRFATPLVRADKPFLFFIHHKQTETILFWGKITKPTPNFPDTPKPTRQKRRRSRSQL